jgi:SAM-dependent methyltransferase
VAEGVKRRLDAVAATTEPLVYAVQMWRSALALAGGGRETPREGLVDELRFPYLPIDPERFGLNLTERSAVLDIGCLAGHGLYDLHVRRSRLGLPVPRLVGLDIDRSTVALAASLAPSWSGRTPVDFVAARCETSPFAAASFDLVLARVVLPYAELERSMERVSAVMRPGGLALLQVHAPRYYLIKLMRNLGRPLVAGYYGRALLSGVAYALTGRQLRSPRFQETPLGLRQLAVLAARHRLESRWSQRHSSRPLMLFQRR